MSEWREAALSDVAEISLSNVDKKIFPNEIDVLLCNYMDVYANRYINSKLNFSLGSVNKQELDKFRLNEKDVIITKDSETADDIAVPAVVTENINSLVCGYHLAIIRPHSDQLDGLFLMNLFQIPEVKNQFSNYANGITRYGLTKDAIYNIRLRFPTSLPEQRKIAKILSNIDDVIEKTKAAIEKYKAIKQGMMQDLFTRGLDKSGKLRQRYEDAPNLYKKTELGWVPKEWEVVSLGEACEKIQDGTHFSPKSTTGPFMYITSRNIRFGYMDLSDVGAISLSEHEAIYKRCDVRLGDILLTKDGANTGNAALNTIDEPFSLLSSVALLRCDEIKLHNEFLFHTILSPRLQQVIADLMSGNAITRLTLTKIKAIKASVPLYDEQKAIAKKLSTLQSKQQTEELFMQKISKLKHGLMQDLLTGRKPVKVEKELGNTLESKALN